MDIEFKSAWTHQNIFYFFFDLYCVFQYLEAGTTADRAPIRSLGNISAIVKGTHVYDDSKESQ